jgi:hypothetical protein
MTTHDSLLKVISYTIANASPKAEQKKVIIFCQEAGLLTLTEMHRLIRAYGLSGIA